MANPLSLAGSTFGEWTRDYVLLAAPPRYSASGAPVLPAYRTSAAASPV
jgi:hypothetical protein